MKTIYLFPVVMVLAAAVLLLAGCSPYADSIKSLDRAYRAGRIDPRTYFAQRNWLVTQNEQWKAARLAQANANLAQLNANLDEQQAANRAAGYAQLEALRARQSYQQPQFYSPGTRYYQVNPMGNNMYQVQGGGRVPVVP